MDTCRKSCTKKEDPKRAARTRLARNRRGRLFSRLAGSFIGLLVIAGISLQKARAEEPLEAETTLEEERPGFDPARLETRTTREGFAASPGRIRVITYDQGIDDVDEKSWKPLRFVVESYGLECGQHIGPIYWNPDAPIEPLAEDELIPEIELSEEPQAAYFSCEVKYGHEDAWIEILSQSDLIWTADLLPHSWVSSSTMVLLPKLLKPTATNTLTHLPTSEEMLDRIFDELRAFYGSEAVITPEPRIASQHLRVVVENIRGKVIRGETFWELLELDFAVIPNGGEGAKLFIVIDGYFASGPKERAPRHGRYSDLSTEYRRDLDLHLGVLSDRLRANDADSEF